MLKYFANHRCNEISSCTLAHSRFPRLQTRTHTVFRPLFTLPSFSSQPTKWRWWWCFVILPPALFLQIRTRWCVRVFACTFVWACRDHCTSLPFLPILILVLCTPLSLHRRPLVSRTAPSSPPPHQRISSSNFCFVLSVCVCLSVSLPASVLPCLLPGKRVPLIDGFCTAEDNRL